MIPQRIIWHHTADDSQSPQFDKINEYHKSKLFPRSRLGFYVGYHFVVEFDGSIRQARELTEMGAHDKDENFDSIGIALAGNFTNHTVGENQSKGMARLLSTIFQKFPIPWEKVEPHRWRDSTECPGRFLADSWLRENYEAREVRPLFEAPHTVSPAVASSGSGRFPFTKLAAYPHMAPRDVTIWNQYIDLVPAAYVTVDYDTKLGTGGLTLAEIQKDVYKQNIASLQKFRIDVVGFKADGTIDCIEVRPRAGLSAIGSALGYCHFLSVLYPGSKCTPVILTDRAQSDIATLCQQFGVRLIEIAELKSARSDRLSHDENNERITPPAPVPVAPPSPVTPTPTPTPAPPPVPSIPSAPVAPAVGWYVFDPKFLPYYSENQLIRQGEKIYLKPGVTPPRKVSSLTELKKYREADLIRVGTQIWLKPGIG